MTAQDHKLLEVLLDKPIAYHPVFGRVGGGVCPGLFLSQLWYWAPKTKDGEGWIYKTQEDWASETNLSRSEQETARRRLKERGLIEEKLAGVPAKLYYRINNQALWEAINQVTGNPKTRLQETRKQDCDIPANTIRNTENTTKNTTENTGLLWQSVAHACGYRPTMTRDQGRRVNQIMPSLLAMGVSPDEVEDWRENAWLLPGDPWPSQVLGGIEEYRLKMKAGKEELEARIRRKSEKAREQIRRREVAGAKS